MVLRVDPVILKQPSIQNHPYTSANTAVTIGGTGDSDAQAGIFMPNNQAENVTIPASHGPCTEYCGRVFGVSRDYNPSTGALSFVLSHISTGCGTYTRIYEDKWSSICSPYDEILWGGVDSPGPSYSSRDSCCYTVGSGNFCPLGWGGYLSYLSYLPGCDNGSRYPSPTPSSTSLSDVIGSPVLTTVII